MTFQANTEVAPAPAPARKGWYRTDADREFAQALANRLCETRRMENFVSDDKRAADALFIARCQELSAPAVSRWSDAMKGCFSRLVPAGMERRDFEHAVHAFAWEDGNRGKLSPAKWIMLARRF